ncbi:MAG TPA: PIN domain-containing protein [Ktedonobacteraceae bacterium]|nr:PIN domain-containing protein [Ktedonobacteraceae bacterium]
MKWLDSFRGKMVGLDTAPVIYYVEKNPQYYDMMHAFFQTVNAGECAAVTSVVTLLEGLVIPLRRNDTNLVRAYYSLLYDTDDFTTISLFPDTARKASQLRASYKSMRTADSIQIATAIRSNASFFLTNDASLPSIPDLKIIVLEDLRKEQQSSTEP